MILVDINVLLDVIQRREPHYRASATVLDCVVRNAVVAALPAHAVTTVHFLVGRYQNADKASEVVQWLLQRFEIASVGKTELRQAQALGWADFEDAVVAAAAQSAGCRSIVTRNVRDFRGSPIDAITPEEYLLEWSINQPL